MLHKGSVCYQQGQSVLLINQKPSWFMWYNTTEWCLQGLHSNRTANAKVLLHPRIRPPDPQIPGTRHHCFNTEPYKLAPPVPEAEVGRIGRKTSSPLQGEGGEQIKDTTESDSSHQGYQSCIKTILNSLVAHPFRFILLPQYHILLTAH